ncbi:MAG: hypothetical protein LJE68_07380 [Rhodobacter sp.]|nr:hypothetical protein [Rhodobacter sp.]
MSLFHTDKTFFHILLLDADMSFRPEVVLRLIAFRAAFTCAAYPQRNLSLEQIRRLAENDAAAPKPDRQSTEALLAKALAYNVQATLNLGEPWQSEHRDGFRTVSGAGTGLMLIERTVPETMVASGAAPARKRHNALPLYSGAEFHDFFSHLTDRDGDLMYGEDQSFCRRWVAQCGGRIWCDKTAIVTHHGHFPYRGQYNLKGE